MPLKSIFIFRHGETDYNAEERFQGHLDIPLNEKGRAQARELSKKLADKNLDVILSSDLSRAKETAEIVSEDKGLKIFTDAGLREAHLGGAQGKSLDEIQAAFGVDTTKRWRSSHPTDADISYPGGETGQQVMDRVFRALENFLESQPFQRVGVATHGGVIRRIFQKILPKESGPVPIPNTVLYELAYDTDSKTWYLVGEQGVRR